MTVQQMRMWEASCWWLNPGAWKMVTAKTDTI